MKSTLRNIGMALGATMLLAACGGGDAPAAGGGAPAGGGAGAGAGDATQATVTLSLATVTTESSVWAGYQLVEAVYEYSGGTLILEHFPYNQLGADRVAIEATIFGDIDIAMSATSPLVDLFPDFALFDTHFLFRDRAHAHEVSSNHIGQQLLDSMADHGLKGWGFWEMGFRNLTNSVRPVHSPADAQGLVVRTLENPLHIAVWNALGANPTPMSFAELFTAMQQGTVDGQENPLSIIDANSFYEVQDYIVLTQHAYVPHVITMNMAAWNGLSELHQDALTRAFERITPQQWERAGNSEAEIYERLQAQGNVSIISLTPEQHDQFASIIAESDVLDLIRSTMNNPHLLDEVLAN